MKTIPRAYLHFIPSLFLINCLSTTLTRPKVTEVYQNDTLVQIKLFGSRINPVHNDKKSNMLCLSEAGQAEYIKAIKDLYDMSYKSEKNYNKDDTSLTEQDKKFNRGLNKINSALKVDCFAEEEGNITDYYLNQDLKMVFSIIRAMPDTENKSIKNIKKRPFSPADRIEFLNFSLTIDPKSGLKFTKWNKYSTEYNTINIADMTFTKASEIGGVLGGEYSGAKAEVRAKSTRGIEEKQSIRHRYMVSSGCITDSSIEITEEGTPENDLAGNVSADVSLRFPGTLLRTANFDSLFHTVDYKNLCIPADSVNVNFQVVSVPYFDGTLPDTIYGCLNMSYLYRHVFSGFQTVYEYDDKVNYFKGNTAKPVLLFTKYDYMPDFYYIGETSGADCPVETKLLIRDSCFKNDHNKCYECYPMVFKKFMKAREFLKWLINDTSVTKNDSVSFRSGEYTLIRRTTDSPDSILTRRMIKSMNLTVLRLSQMKELERF